MAMVFMESLGWALGAAATWLTRYNSTGSAWSITATGPFSGDAAIAQSGNNVATLNLRATINPTIRVGFWWFCDNWGLGTTTGQTLTILGDAAAVQCYISVNGATKTLQFRNGANTLLASGTKVLQNNSWYYVEALITLSNTVGTISLSIDNVADIVATGLNNRNTANNNITAVAFRGVVTANTRWAQMFGFDGGVLQGPSRISLLTPTADGAVAAWTPSTGTTLFNLVDEIPPNGDTDYISSATPTQQALFTFTSLPYTPNTIYGVQVSLYAKRDDAAARSLACLVRSGGTSVTGTTQAVTASYLDFYLQIYELNPVTVAAWTAADVNAVQAGVECIS